MAVFYSGVFNPNVYFTEGGTVEVVKTGTGGIDPPKRKRIYKPTGLPLKPRKEGRKSPQDRVDESEQLQAEITGRLSREFTEENLARTQEAQEAQAVIAQAQMDAEIAFLMKEKMREEDEEIIHLIVAIAAKDF